MGELSLSDVARLARVSRPVVTMWTKRPKNGLCFPAQDAEGRVDADELVDWLEATGRGNNPEARAEVALRRAVSQQAPTDELEAMLALLAARAVIDESLARLDREDLLDRVEEADPDDEWLLSETEQAWTPELATRVDAVVDAAWNGVAAYEALRDQYLARASAQRLTQPLVELLAGAARSMVSGAGRIVDVRGACSDVAVALARDEDHEMPGLLLVAGGAGTMRPVRRRLAVHRINARVARLEDDWAPPAGSAVLLRLPDATAASLDLLNEVSLQLGEGVPLLAVGPAALLTDVLEEPEESARDELLRSGAVRAVIQLPSGVLHPGQRERMALWLLCGSAGRRRGGPVRVGDMSGVEFTDANRRNLLGDLLATADGGWGHVFTLLRPVAQANLVAEPGPLVRPVRVDAPLIGATPVEDAARMQQLYDTLAETLPPWRGGFTAVVEDPGRLRAERVSLGAAIDRRMGEPLLRLRRGRRLPELPAGDLARWTATDIATGTPSSTDRLALTAAVPDHELTEPGDVVFTVHPTPAAVVDRRGGAVVAYPARVLRVLDPQRLSVSAIAAVIDAHGPRDKNWRGWLVPLRAAGTADPEEFLTHLEGWLGLLEQWRAQTDELRSLVIGSTLSGAVTMRIRGDDDDDENEKGGR